MNARNIAYALIPVFFALAFAATTGMAQASVRSISHGGSYWGSVIVEPGQVVDGDLNVMLGSATIEGTVNGDVNVVGGDVYPIAGSTITGQVHAVGGDVVQSIVPWAPSDGVRDTVAQNARVLWRLAWDVVVLVMFLIFPVRTRMALDRLERHPGLSTAGGLIGWIAIVPLAVLLAVTIVLIPLIPVELAAVAAAVFIGKAALALLVGRRLAELLSPTFTPTPMGALLLGLVLLTAAEMIPVMGALVSIIVGLVGLGAVILTFIGEHAPWNQGGGVQQRPPVSGPPMPVG